MLLASAQHSSGQTRSSDVAKQYQRQWKTLQPLSVIQETWTYNHLDTILKSCTSALAKIETRMILTQRGKLRSERGRGAEDTTMVISPASYCNDVIRLIQTDDRNVHLDSRFWNTCYRNESSRPTSIVRLPLVLDKKLKPSGQVTMQRESLCCGFIPGATEITGANGMAALF